MKGRGQEGSWGAGRGLGAERGARKRPGWCRKVQGEAWALRRAGGGCWGLERSGETLRRRADPSEEPRPGDRAARAPGRAGGENSRGGGATGSQRGAGRGPKGGSEVGPRATPHPLLLSSSGARAAAATSTSHCLLQLSSDGIFAPPLSPKGPASPRLLQPPIGQARRHSSVRCSSLLSYWPNFTLPSPPSLSVPRQNPATPALPTSAASCCQWLTQVSFSRHHGDVSHLLSTTA